MRSERLGMATIPDVARHAGVSTATAARALGGYGSVSPATREKVAAASLALGYRANSLARSMITGSTHTLGVVLADIENPFFYRALRGITDVARSKGFDVLLANTDENLDAERNALTVLAERRVDGLIVCPAEAEDASHLSALIESGVPIVLLDRQIRGLRVDSVGIDNRRAAKRATQSLIDLGHRRVAALTGGNPVMAESYRRRGMKGVERLTVTTAGLRGAGYRDAMVGAGLELRPEYISVGGFRREEAAASTAELLRLPEPPTAILAFDSILALGALTAIRDLGVRCPQDVSLLGFDDADWSEVVSPALSVVSQPVYEIGANACELLLSRVNGSDARPVHHRLKTTIIQRGSTAAPAS